MLLIAASGIVFLGGCAAKKGCGCGNKSGYSKPRKFNK